MPYIFLFIFQRKLNQVNGREALRWRKARSPMRQSDDQKKVSLDQSAGFLHAELVHGASAAGEKLKYTYLNTRPLSNTVKKNSRSLQKIDFLLIINNCFARFLHPGVTDKGNYNMFDVIRGVPTAPARDPQPPESAWERGLRTAKEVKKHIF